MIAAGMDYGWRGITSQNYSLYLKVWFKIYTNVRVTRTRMDFIFWKRRTEIFLQLKTYMKTNTRLLLYREKQRFCQGGAF